MSSEIDDDDLTRLAMDVADGHSVDWSLERSGHPDIAPLVDQLRQVQNILSAHWTNFGEPDAESPAEARDPAHGASWGSLRVLTKLGEGSYGEVFRAYDPALQHEVALKLLSQDSGMSSLTVQRYLEEARKLARVRNGHVVTVYGADQREDRVGIWMELVRGRTLEELLEIHGRFGPRETAVIGMDLCQALSAIHACELVHGDVKTSNVMREEGGRIVLMDFGAAEELTPEEPSAHSGSTGTPLAMAPERLRGERADRRADLYGLGALLYRLLTRRYPIEATSLAELREKHERRESVPLHDLRADLPADLVRVVEKALAHDPDQRHPSAGALERALAQAIGTTVDVASADAQGARRSRRARAVQWAMIVGTATLVIAFVFQTIQSRRSRSAAESRQTRFSIAIPDGQALGGYAQAAISPNGDQLVLAATDSSGTSRLWMRPMNSFSARPLPGTEGAFYPFWSPDDQFVGFFARGKLKKILLESGLVQVICDARAGRGATWGVGDVILFAPATEGPLFRVTAAGGAAVEATRLGPNEVAHRWPCFLPDGRHYLYMALPATDGEFVTYVGSLDSKEFHRLLSASTAAQSAPPRHVLFMNDDRLMVQTMDVGLHRLLGEPRQITNTPRVLGALGEPNATASKNGTLAYLGAVEPNTQLVWLDRSGRLLETLPAPPAAYFSPRISPDGQRIAVERGLSGTASDIRLVDLERGVTTPFSSGSLLDRYPQWSPDGRQLVFASGRKGTYGLYRRWVDRPELEQALITQSGSLLEWPTDWSRDGRWVLFDRNDPVSGYDLWVLPMSGTLRATPFLRSPSNESGARLSPDGRWVAFVSDESGREEIYVLSFPDGRVRHQVSTRGGDTPRWGATGRELFYLAPGGNFMTVRVHGPPWRADAPELLFQQSNLRDFDVSRDGNRFLGVLPVKGRSPSIGISVVQNWAAGAGH